MLAKSLAFFSLTTSKRSGSTSNSSARSNTVCRGRCLQAECSFEALGQLQHLKLQVPPQHRLQGEEVRWVAA